MKISNLLISFILLCLASFANSNAVDAIAKAKAVNLYEHPTWLKLLHYEATGLTGSTFKSAVISTEFFLASDGNRNAQSELEATISAIYLENTSSQDKHVQCKFKGRYIWLLKVLGLQETPFVSCPKFDKFSFDSSISSISIVLATGYLGNPASYYGHTLLKLNSSKNLLSGGLLDQSVNYGAIIPDNTNPVAYIFNGITGGYEGGFTHIQYYFHNHNYGEIELRDLWEYQLDLTQEEVDLILGHAWEMLGQKYNYYFFRKNCAYRMAELLEVATDLDIIPENYVYTIPQALIQKISNTSVNGEKLVNSVKYHPSRQADLYRGYKQLSTEEGDIVSAIIANIDYLELPHYLLLGDNEKLKIIDVLLDYYRFLQVIETPSNAGRNTEESPEYYRILSERFKLPSLRGSPIEKRLLSPSDGRKPSLLRFSVRSNSEVDSSGLSVLLRPAYYDSLDADVGHVKHAYLSMLEAEFKVFSGHVKIDHIDFIAIESINPSVTGLAGDQGDAWRIKLGVERQNLNCSECLIARFQGDIGRTMPISESLLLGFYLGGAIQEQRNDQGYGFGRASIFSNYQKNQLSGRLGVEAREHLDSRASGELVYFLEGRYKVSLNQEFRVKYEKNVAEELSISYGFYW